MVTNWSPSRHFLNPAIISKKHLWAPNVLCVGSDSTLCFVFVRSLRSFRDSSGFIRLFCRRETSTAARASQRRWWLSADPPRGAESPCCGQLGASQFCWGAVMPSVHCQSAYSAGSNM